jgi:hypothetical protein
MMYLPHDTEPGIICVFAVSGNAYLRPARYCPRAGGVLILGPGR